MDHLPLCGDPMGWSWSLWICQKLRGDIARGVGHLDDDLVTAELRAAAIARRAVAAAAGRPSRRLAPDPAVSPASTKSGGRDAWLAMPGDGSKSGSERGIVFVIDKS